MRVSSTWLISVGVVGTMAMVLAASLVWLVITQPVATAQALSAAF